ncbi:hypothetical protein CN326_09905 [Bacillus sp. AFS018417]|jgi:uncharacterized protein YutE (UPF0331/DUF86 family)|uniref:DUF86 domain-containing protein n=2 Tax=Bacillus TaxID=1386 RepID=A0ABU8FVV4_9BACI|nr:MULTISPECIES: DUF86 domain-containing protein [Bacillus]MCP1125840.1 DUF86 domain-containing protein [Bacillus sp. 3103sda1]PEZ06552.1 hypothetical protein CN326_09905 [Bacillus sp. AFS018417]CAG9612547.1 hypothetical protein BACCIP111899_01724 [Bacillus rhizoplanae]
MYFVDRKKIEQMLQCLEKVVAAFQTKQEYRGALDEYALERMAHLMIDCILDVGNAMIDGFIMRDPGSYEDIIDILMDEKVVTNEEGERLKEVVRLRKMIVQEYVNMNHTEVYDTVQKHIDMIKQYPANIRRYLEQELGPVSAFAGE